MTTTTHVLRLLLKDKHAAMLDELAGEVNFVWNYCNELVMKVWARERRFMSGYDFHPYTKGAGKAGLSLHSQTIQAVGEEYASRRKQARKLRLRWRVSRGSRRSPGWVPFKRSAITYRNGQVHFCGTPLSLWDSYGLAGYALGAGSFSEDARGRWYFNVSVKTAQPANSERQKCVGIDLGLKDFAALSGGRVVEAQHFYRDLLSQARRERARSRVCARCTRSSPIAGKISCTNFLAGSLRSTAQSS